MAIMHSAPKIDLDIFFIVFTSASHRIMLSGTSLSYRSFSNVAAWF